MDINPNLPAPARRTQAERRAQSDRSLLLAAAELIAEEGFQAATFEKVGARAGFSRGLASQRFGSKDGLIEALIDYLHMRTDELAEGQHLEELPGLEALLASVEIYLRNFEEEQAVRSYFIVLAGSVATLSKLRSAFAASHQLAKHKFETLILKGQQDGSITPSVDAESAALMVGSLLLGLSTQYLIDPTTDISRIRETAIATLRLSLGQR